MAIGAMRESLAFQIKAVSTSSGSGIRTPVWSTYATVAGDYL
jgi:hypothetical protein